MLSSVLGTLATILLLIITVGLITQTLIISIILVYQLYKFGPRPSSVQFWSKLLGFLKPDMMVDKFANIDLIKLSRYGAVNLVLDLDNTLALPGSKEAIESIVTMLRDAKIRGLVKHVAIVSNLVVATPRRKWRVWKIGLQIGADINNCICAVGLHSKPSPVPIKKALASMPGATSLNTIMIGDQWSTDCWAAKRAGLQFILVKPLGDEKIYTSWKRGLERLFFRLAGW